MSTAKKPIRRPPGVPVSSVDDRRSVCRYAAVQTQAWLGWWEGPDFRSTTAQVVDISLRGCMMIVEQLPPADQSVWFCPPGTTPSEWIEAKLIEATRCLLGPRTVRIAFYAPFAYETFKNVVYGPESMRGHATAGSKAPRREGELW
jgi:hypothetical protein